jgi:5'-nucleotidase
MPVGLAADQPVADTRTRASKRQQETSDVTTPYAHAGIARRTVLIAATIALLGGLLGAAPALARHDAKVDYQLTILHNNDAETTLLPSSSADGPYAGIAYFKALMDRLAAKAVTSGRDHSVRKGVLKLSSGDNYLAGAQFNASLAKGVPFYDSIGMRAVGYDAIGIGNHDFDFGPDTFADFIAGFSARTPFVSANLDVSAEPRLAALAAAHRIVPSVVVREGGELIGIVGATTPTMPTISSARNVIVTAVAPAVQREVNRLTRRGINKIVLISHLQSVAEDQALLSGLHGVDVAISGGGAELLANPADALAPGDTSASIYGPYPLTATDKTGRSIPVITTDGDYKYIGELVVSFDKRGNVVRLGSDSGAKRVVGFGSDGVRADRYVTRKVVNPVAAYVASLAANVLATSDVPLNGLRGQVVAGTEAVAVAGIRTAETNLGDLAADAVLWEAQQRAAAYGVDVPTVGLQNGGGIRNASVIPAGHITELDTFSIFAFANFIAVKEDLTAAQLKAVLETSVSEVGNGRFAQWSGVSFTYDITAQRRVIDPTNCSVSNPGSRVTSVSVGGVPIFDAAGVDVSPAGWTVDVATIAFTFNGGDCYDFGPGGSTTVGTTYQQALANYLVTGLGGHITAAAYPVGGSGRFALK